MTILNDLFDMDSTEGRDLSRTRVLDLENGNSYILEAKDPYGFWYVRAAKGNVPEHLKGAFTSFAKAEEAVKLYLDQQNSEKVTQNNIVKVRKVAAETKE